MSIVMALSQPKILSSLFRKAVDNIDEVIKPVFNAAVSRVSALMDKIGVMGKAGQALFDKEGMQHGGNNFDLGNRRKTSRLRRSEELKTFKFSFA